MRPPKPITWPAPDPSGGIDLPQEEWRRVLSIQKMISVGALLVAAILLVVVIELLK